QTWLEQYGLVKKTGIQAVVSNDIYRARYIKRFFNEVKAGEQISPQTYTLDGGQLDMNRILLNFNRYIAQIGVNAFYLQGKPYEKTGQFLLTAWLYQFVSGSDGDLRYEVRTGMGRMDILLIYKGKKYIIETKMNRHKDIRGIIEEGVTQLTTKYLATENTTRGYLVVFDVNAPVGTVCHPHDYEAGDKKVTGYIIGIGKED
ncbi:MAG: hypothetical protein GY757_58360, partial [bacterium]|nr:hypothetical protein [bacterium]